MSRYYTWAKTTQAIEYIVKNTYRYKIIVYYYHAKVTYAQTLMTFVNIIGTAQMDRLEIKCESVYTVVSYNTSLADNNRKTN